MAGKSRRNFVTIISDKFVDKYQGCVAPEELSAILSELHTLVAKLDESKKSKMRERSKSLRQLRRLPLEKLQEILKKETKKA